MHNFLFSFIYLKVINKKYNCHKFHKQQNL